MQAIKPVSDPRGIVYENARKFRLSGFDKALFSVAFIGAAGYMYSIVTAPKKSPQILENLAVEEAHYATHNYLGAIKLRKPLDSANLNAARQETISALENEIKAYQAHESASSLEEVRKFNSNRIYGAASMFALCGAATLLALKGRGN